MLRFNRSHLPLDQKMQDFWDINGFLVIEDFYAHEECDKLIYKSEKFYDKTHFTICHVRSASFKY